MDLSKEYAANPRIDGKPAVLNTVTNEIDPVTNETVITRTYVTSDLKKSVVHVERIPGKPRAIAPAPEPVPDVTEAESTPDSPSDPVPVPKGMKFQRVRDIDLAPGLVVGFVSHTGRFLGTIVKVMLKTVAIDVGGQKDLSVNKSQILGTPKD